MGGNQETEKTSGHLSEQLMELPPAEMGRRGSSRLWRGQGSSGERLRATALGISITPAAQVRQVDRHRSQDCKCILDWCPIDGA